MSKKFLTLGALVALAGQASALTITPTFVAAAGETWTADRTGVVVAAINDWTSRIGDAHNIDVQFTFRNSPDQGFLAVWEGQISADVGADLYAWSPGVTHTVVVNTAYLSGANPLWFDPTPATRNDLGFSSFDALSVMRHEIGHMLGFTNEFYVNKFYTDDAVDKWGSRIVDGVFDPGGLSISMAGADNAHINQSYSLMMSPAIVNGVRHDITDTDLAMLSATYGYTIIPEPSTWGAAGLGALAFVGLVRRRRARAVA